MIENGNVEIARAVQNQAAVVENIVLGIENLKSTNDTAQEETLEINPVKKERDQLFSPPRVLNTTNQTEDRVDTKSQVKFMNKNNTKEIQILALTRAKAQNHKNKQT